MVAILKKYYFIHCRLGRAKDKEEVVSCRAGENMAMTTKRDILGEGKFLQRSSEKAFNDFFFTKNVSIFLLVMYKNPCEYRLNLFLP